MKKSIITLILTLASMATFAQTKIEDSVKQIVKDFENVAGVESMVIEKGEGLGLIKMAMSKEFGKKFMKGVTSMILINFKGVSEQDYKKLHARFNSFSSVLEEVHFEGEELNEGEYLKCFANTKVKDSIKDFMVIVEDKEDKMFMYMGGEILIDELKLIM